MGGNELILSGDFSTYKFLGNLPDVMAPTDSLYWMYFMPRVGPYQFIAIELITTANLHIHGIELYP